MIKIKGKKCIEGGVSMEWKYKAATLKNTLEITNFEIDAL